MQAASAPAQAAGSSADGYDADAQKEIDNRSIYVGNVEYTVESAQLAEFFGVRCSPAFIMTQDEQSCSCF